MFEVTTSIDEWDTAIGELECVEKKKNNLKDPYAVAVMHDNVENHVENIENHKVSKLNSVGVKFRDLTNGH